MDEQLHQLYNHFKVYEGKNFEVTIQDSSNPCGFSTCNVVEKAQVNGNVERIVISEPVTANYYSLPRRGMVEFRMVSGDQYGAEFKLEYANGFSIVVHIFEPL